MPVKSQTLVMDITNNDDQATSKESDTVHLEHTTTRATQEMDGSDYHTLLPKPSNDPNDPLNWTWTEKHITLAVVACMAFQGAFDVASPAAGFIQQAEAFNVPVVSMLDSVGVNAICLGIGSFIWLPLGNTYGRRPIFIAAGVVATLGALGCALANNLGAFIGARAVNGLGCSASMTLGGQVWMQWLCFFMWCALLPPCALLLPETLYHRRHGLLEIPPRERWVERLKWKRFDTKLNAEIFFGPFRLLKYPSVVLMGIYYGNVYGFCVFGALAILPFAFPANYGFNAVGQGLVTVALLVGTVLGEPMAGPFSDWVVRWFARRNGGIRHPEQRLHALWLGAAIIPAGLIMFGTTLQYKVHWIAPCVAIGLYSFALQSVTTVTFTYPVDCYENRAGEVGVILNMGRQIFSFYVSFYLHKYTERVGYAWAYGIYAILSCVLFLPIIALMRWGGHWRKQLGSPGTDLPNPNVSLSAVTQSETDTKAET
ncbi:hypothetical protein B7463_g6927, partial [Scytalidium lignicola]